MRVAVARLSGPPSARAAFPTVAGATIDRTMAPPPDRPPRRRPLPGLLGIGARGAGRVASATGIDDAVERTTEEAIVRALESPAVERAIVRVLEGDEAQAAIERALASPAAERTAVQVLDSELVDRVWERLLASDEAQKLVERIAEAPEVRAAIASQGVGLLSDLGRGLREIADRLDAGIDRIVRRLRGLGPRTEPVVCVGPVVRAIALVIDGALLNLSYLAISAIFGLTVSGTFGDDGGLSASEFAVGGTLWIIAAGTYLGLLWSLAGQTIGMRFLSIRLDVDGGRLIGARRATRRVIGTALSVLTLGIGFVIALFATAAARSPIGWRARPWSRTTGPRSRPGRNPRRRMGRRGPGPRARSGAASEAPIRSAGSGIEARLGSWPARSSATRGRRVPPDGARSASPRSARSSSAIRRWATRRASRWCS
ncbi:MAG: hypothetical protein GEU88_00210 [Solirubrobacterales bacterium]|nr:hypothetical protein [Solirubrobacterales bacterium]